MTNLVLPNDIFVHIIIPYLNHEDTDNLILVLNLSSLFKIISDLSEMIRVYSTCK